MKSFYIIITVMFCMISTLKSQLTTDWYHSIGSPASEVAGDLKTDDAGNTYFIVVLKEPTDIDPGPGQLIITPAQETAETLIKLNADGDLVWYRVFNVGFEGYGNLYQINHNRIYLSFHFVDTLSMLAPGINYILNTNPGTNNCVLGLSLDGQVKESYYFPTPDYFFLQNILSFPDHSVVVCGSFRDTFNIKGSNTTLIARGNRDGFVMALDPQFNLTWSRHFGGAGPDGFYSIFSKQEKIYFTLEFRDTLYVPAGGTYVKVGSAGNDDILFGYMNMQGQLQKYFHLGAEGADEGRDIVADNAGNMYLCGNFEKTMNFAGTGASPVYHTSVNAEDGFVAKYNPEGQLLWTRIYTSGNYGGIHHIHLKRSNELYFHGYFTQHADLNPGPDSLIFQTQSNQPQTFISKLNTEGDFLWSYCFPSTIESSFRQIGISTETNKVYAGGYYGGSVNCTPMMEETLMTAQGGHDYFIIALDEANVISASSPIHSINFDIYPNPTTDQISITTETDITSATLFDMNGRLVRQWSQKGLKEKKLSVEDLQPGMYFIQLASEDSQLSKKLIIH